MKKCNVYVAAASVLFGVLIIYMGRNLSGYDDKGIPGENFWPFVLAYLFIGLGLLQMIDVFFISHKKPDKAVDLSSKAVRMAYLSALVSVVYGGLLLCVGFVAATLVFVPSLMSVMGERKVWVSALVSVSVVGTIYVFFALVFNTTLPTSVFFD